MLGRLLKKLFRREEVGREPATSRPVSPPRPVVARAPLSPMAAPPPPPPPPAPVPAPAQARPEAPVAEPPAALDPLGLEPVAAMTEAVDPAAPAAPAQVDEDDAEQTRVRLVLQDGTTATPGLDPESEERLRYILDNIVPPPDGAAT